MNVLAPNKEETESEEKKTTDNRWYENGNPLRVIAA